MVRDLRYPWETLLLIDDANGRLYCLQERLKIKAGPAEVVAAWQEIRDLVDRHLRTLCPEISLRSPSERALSILQEGLGNMLLLWDLSQSQRDRLELLLRKAEREHLGAEAVAA